MLEPLHILRSLGLPEADEVVRVHGGADTAMWHVQRGRAEYALRVLQPGMEERAGREVQAMHAASGAGVPVPTGYAQGVWEGRPALLMAWSPGRPILFWLRRYPWSAYRYGREFGRLHAQIHSARVRLSSSVWLERVDPTIASALGSQMRCHDSLLHLDYHVLNVLQDEKQITAVLDWANAGAGDPRMDAARTETILRLDMGRPERGLLCSAPLLPLWHVFLQGWRTGYQEAGGSLLSPLFLAAAGSFMERDLARRYAPEQLAYIRRWTERHLAMPGE